MSVRYPGSRWCCRWIELGSRSLSGCGLDYISLPVATFERQDRGLGHVGRNRFVIVPRLGVGDAFYSLRHWSLLEYEGLATEIC